MPLMGTIGWCTHALNTIHGPVDIWSVDLAFGWSHSKATTLFSETSAYTVPTRH